MSIRKRRPCIQGKLPCIKCGQEIPVPIFEVILPKNEQPASSYMPNRKGTPSEIRCPSCGTDQSFQFTITARQIAAA